MSERAKPERREAYAYFRTITTRWMDNDVFRHINNVTYYSFFDTAVCQYLIEQGALDIETSPVVGLVAETMCRYFSPVAFPSLIHAGIRVGHQGNTSVRYEIGLFKDDDDLASAQGHFVHVYVDRVSGRPAPLPDTLKAALAPLSRRPVSEGGDS
ncbi:MAG: acyl-CoA thioesterase [Bradyrhizobiaceae bacterium]|nr:MAG: acyl-CoA thioesterase [Bradyrhizobiaceae bacterium]